LLAAFDGTKLSSNFLLEAEALSAGKGLTMIFGCVV
jgi:hypothetical protein